MPAIKKIEMGYIGRHDDETGMDFEPIDEALIFLNDDNEQTCHVEGPNAKVMAQQIVAAVRSTPVPCDGEAVAWVVFAENGNVRLWGKDRAGPQAFADEKGLKCEPVYLATPPARSDAPAYRMGIFEAAKRASAKCPDTAPGKRWLEAFRAELPVERSNALRFYIHLSNIRDRLTGELIMTDGVSPMSDDAVQVCEWLNRLDLVPRSDAANTMDILTARSAVTEAAAAITHDTTTSHSIANRFTEIMGAKIDAAKTHQRCDAGSGEAIARDLAECIGRYMSETDYRSRLLPSAAEFVAKRGLTIPSAEGKTP